MTLLNGIRTFLTAKAVPVAAATLVIGGGAAIAAPGGPFGAEDGGGETELSEFPGEGWALGRADSEQADRIAAFCDENPQAAFCRGESYVPDAADDYLPEVPGLEEDGEDDRSDTARRVHEALTGDDTIVPGDPDFGPTVSQRARSGQLGGLVSRAARGEPLEDDDFDLEPRQPGPPDHARGGSGTDDGAGDEPVTTEADPKAERRGPPPAASRGNSGNSGNRGPQGMGPRG